ncbi:unnamed protein product [Amoebophrya sp. A25]|nr:unnamed protein product [Amoebophrya sp. A25]|eukprot:GSA25T00010083001.1
MARFKLGFSPACSSSSILPARTHSWSTSTVLQRGSSRVGNVTSGSCPHMMSIKRGFSDDAEITGDTGKKKLEVDGAEGRENRDRVFPRPQVKKERKDENSSSSETTSTPTSSPTTTASEYKKEDDILNQQVMAFVAATPPMSDAAATLFDKEGGTIEAQRPPRQLLFGARRNLNRHTRYRIAQLERDRLFLMDQAALQLKLQKEEKEGDHVEEDSSIRKTAGEAEGDGDVLESTTSSPSSSTEEQRASSGGDAVETSNSDAASTGEEKTSDSGEDSDYLTARKAEEQEEGFSSCEDSDYLTARKAGEEQEEGSSSFLHEDERPADTRRPRLMYTKERWLRKMAEISREKRLLSALRHGRQRPEQLTAENFLQTRLTAYRNRGAKGHDAGCSTSTATTEWSEVRDYSRLPHVMTTRPSAMPKRTEDPFVVLDQQRSLSSPCASAAAKQRLETLWRVSNSHGVSWDELDCEYMRWAQQGQARATIWNGVVWPRADLLSRNDKKVAKKEEILEKLVAGRKASAELRMSRETDAAQAKKQKEMAEAKVKESVDNVLAKMFSSGDAAKDKNNCSTSEADHVGRYGTTLSPSTSSSASSGDELLCWTEPPEASAQDADVLAEDLLDRIRDAAYWRASNVIDARIRKRKKKDENFSITPVQRAAMVSGLRRTMLHKWKQLYLQWWRPGQLVRHLREFVLLRQNERELAERFQCNPKDYSCGGPNEGGKIPV